MSLISDFEPWHFLHGGKQCPHCAQRRKAEVTIYWNVHDGNGNCQEVIFCDACAVRLARGILQDVDDSMRRTNLLASESVEEAKCKK